MRDELLLTPERVAQAVVAMRDGHTVTLEVEPGPVSAEGAALEVREAYRRNVPEPERRRFRETIETFDNSDRARDRGCWRVTWTPL